MRKTIKLLFSGKVQNVGFRTYMKNVGQNLGLCGEVEKSQPRQICLTGGYVP